MRDDPLLALLRRGYASAAQAQRLLDSAQEELDQHRLLNSQRLQLLEDIAREARHFSNRLLG